MIALNATFVWPAKMLFDEKKIILRRVNETIIIYKCADFQFVLLVTLTYKMYAVYTNYNGISIQIYFSIFFHLASVKIGIGNILTKLQ